MSSTTTRSQIGSKDLKMWDGKNRTYTRLTSTGGSLTLNALGSSVDVLEVYGGGTSYTDTAIADAIAAIGTTTMASLLLQPGTWVIDANQTISSNLTLVCPPGTILSVVDACTLTISGGLEAGPYQIFTLTGTGAVVFGSNSPAAHQVYPDWWYTGSGHWDTPLAKATAAVKNAGGGVVKLTRNITLGTNFDLDIRYITFDGGGYEIDASAITSGTAIDIINSEDAANSYLKVQKNWFGNFHLIGDSKTGAVTGLYYYGSSANLAVSGAAARNVYIYNFAYGVSFYSNTWNLSFHNCTINSNGVGVYLPTGGSNYGESIRFFGCGVHNNNLAIHAKMATTSGIDFFGCSLDHNVVLADIDTVVVDLHGCWVEGTGYLGSSESEAIKVANGGHFQMRGGNYVGIAAYTANYDYLVNVVDTESTAIFDKTYVQTITTATGYLVTGNGIFIWSPIGYQNSEVNGFKWNSYTKGDLADGGFETSAGSTLMDYWHVREGGAVTDRWTTANLALTSSNTHARTGTFSLKADKLIASDATFGVLVPIRRPGACPIARFYYKKPGNGTGDMHIAGYWAQVLGNDANGAPIAPKVTLINTTTITFVAAAVDWTAYTDTNRNYDYRAPDWATHYLLFINITALTSGQAYYFDDFMINLD